MTPRFCLVLLVVAAVGPPALGQYYYPSGGCTGGSFRTSYMAWGGPRSAPVYQAPLPFAPGFSAAPQDGLYVPQQYGQRYGPGYDQPLRPQAYPDWYASPAWDDRRFGGPQPYGFR